MELELKGLNFMDNLMLKGFKSIIIYMSERANLFTIILLITMFTSVYSCIQNTIISMRFNKIQNNVALISDNIKTKDSIENIGLKELTSELESVITQIEKDNWNLHTKVITAIGQTHHETLDPKTGVVMFKNN